MCEGKGRKGMGGREGEEGKGRKGRREGRGIVYNSPAVHALQSSWLLAPVTFLKVPARHCICVRGRGGRDERRKKYCL